MVNPDEVDVRILGEGDKSTLDAQLVEGTLSYCAATVRPPALDSSSPHGVPPIFAYNDKSGMRYNETMSTFMSNRVASFARHLSAGLLGIAGLLLFPCPAPRSRAAANT